MSISIKVFVDTYNTLVCDIYHTVKAVPQAAGIKKVNSVTVGVQLFVGVAKQHYAALLLTCRIFKVVYAVFYPFHVAVCGVNPLIFYCADIPCRQGTAKITVATHADARLFVTVGANYFFIFAVAVT